MNEQQKVDYDAIAAAVKSGDIDYDAVAREVSESQPRHAFTAEEFTPPTGPQGSALRRFGSNLGQQLDPRNLGQAVRHPLDTLERIAGAANKNRLMAHEAFDKGDVVQGVARSVGGVPIVGPMLTGIGEQIGSGDYAGAAGTATGIGVLGAAAKVTPAVARAIPTGASRVASGVAGTARTMVENPLATAAGAYEGYQAAGMPGAVAGAVGLPVGLRGVTKLLRPIVSKTDDANAQWSQEAKNLNARDAFLKRQAEQEARNLNARDKFLKKQTARETKNVATSRQTESVGIADAATEFRELSRKLVLTPEEMQRFTALKDRMQMSASEAGLSYPAAQSPRRYVGRDAEGTMQLDPQKTLQQQALRKLFQKDQQ